MNLKMTVGQAACRLSCRYTHSTKVTRWLRPVFAESYRLLRVNQAIDLVIVRVWNAPDQSLKVALQIRAMWTTTYMLCRAMSIILLYNKNIVASSEQYCRFVNVSIT